MARKSKLKRLEKELKGYNQAIRLEGGEVLNLTQEQALELFVEATDYAPVSDESGEILTDHREDIELSETAKKIQQALPGQGRFVKTIKGMLEEYPKGADK